MEKLKYMHGDVLLSSVSELPKGLKTVKPKGGRYVLMEGEATGHAHAVLVDGVEVYEDETGTLWLKADKTTSLTHEEHNKIDVAPGIYKIGQQKEVDPFTGEIDSVRD